MRFIDCRTYENPEADEVFRLPYGGPRSEAEDHGGVGDTVREELVGECSGWFDYPDSSQWRVKSRSVTKAGVESFLTLPEPFLQGSNENPTEWIEKDMICSAVRDGWGSSPSDTPRIPSEHSEFAVSKPNSCDPWLWHLSAQPLLQERRMLFLRRKPDGLHEVSQINGNSRRVVRELKPVLRWRSRESRGRRLLALGRKKSSRLGLKKEDIHNSVQRTKRVWAMRGNGLFSAVRNSAMKHYELLLEGSSPLAGAISNAALSSHRDTERNRKGSCPVKLTDSCETSEGNGRPGGQGASELSYTVHLDEEVKILQDSPVSTDSTQDSGDSVSDSMDSDTGQSAFEKRPLSGAGPDTQQRKTIKGNALERYMLGRSMMGHVPKKKKQPMMVQNDPSREVEILSDGETTLSETLALKTLVRRCRVRRYLNKLLLGSLLVHSDLSPQVRRLVDTLIGFWTRKFLPIDGFYPALSQTCRVIASGNSASKLIVKGLLHKGDSLGNALLLDPDATAKPLHIVYLVIISLLAANAIRYYQQVIECHKVVSNASEPCAPFPQSQIFMGASPGGDAFCSRFPSQTGDSSLCNTPIPSSPISNSLADSTRHPKPVSYLTSAMTPPPPASTPNRIPSPTPDPRAIIPVRRGRGRPPGSKKDKTQTTTKTTSSTSPPTPVVVPKSALPQLPLDPPITVKLAASCNTAIECLRCLLNTTLKFADEITSSQSSDDISNAARLLASVTEASRRFPKSVAGTGASSSASSSSGSSIPRESIQQILALLQAGRPEHILPQLTSLIAQQYKMLSGGHSDAEIKSNKFTETLLNELLNAIKQMPHERSNADSQQTVPSSPADCSKMHRTQKTLIEDDSRTGLTPSRETIRTFDLPSRPNLCPGNTPLDFNKSSPFGFFVEFKLKGIQNPSTVVKNELANAWAALDPGQRSAWQRLFEQQQALIMRQTNVNGFNLFSREQNQMLRLKNVNASPSEIEAYLLQHWRNLPDDKKRIYALRNRQMVESTNFNRRNESTDNRCGREERGSAPQPYIDSSEGRSSDQTGVLTESSNQQMANLPLSHGSLGIPPGTLQPMYPHARPESLTRAIPNREIHFVTEAKASEGPYFNHCSETSQNIQRSPILQISHEVAQNEHMRSHQSLQEVSSHISEEIQTGPYIHSAAPGGFPLESSNPPGRAERICFPNQANDSLRPERPIDTAEPGPQPHMFQSVHHHKAPPPEKEENASQIFEKQFQNPPILPETVPQNVTLSSLGLPLMGFANVPNWDENSTDDAVPLQDEVPIHKDILINHVAPANSPSVDTLPQDGSTSTTAPPAGEALSQTDTLDKLPPLQTDMDRNRNPPTSPQPRQMRTRRSQRLQKRRTPSRREEDTEIIENTENVVETLEPQEATLWSIVQSNRRPSKRKKKSDKADKEQNLEEKTLGDLEQNDQAALFPDEGNATDAPVLEGLFHTPEIDNRSSQLQLNETGNIVFHGDNRFGIDNASQDSIFDPVQNDDLESLLQGRQTVMQCSGPTHIQPFAGAYKKNKGFKWNEADTKRFYEAIEIFGTDLLMVKSLLPGFTDKQIHDKLKIEERKNGQKVEAALKCRREVTAELFETVNGKIDPSTHYHPDADPDNQVSGDETVSAQCNTTDNAAEDVQLLQRLFA